MTPADIAFLRRFERSDVHLSDVAILVDLACVPPGDVAELLSTTEARVRVCLERARRLLELQSFHATRLASSSEGQ